MGRVKTRFIKARGREIFEEYKDNLTSDFTKNKSIVDKVTVLHSKKIRNILAGYVTKLKKSVKDWEVKI